MKLLAVDTALGACSVAVLDGGETRAHIFEAMDRGHAERLAPMVDEAMRQAGLSFAALDRLAVTTGPGTFTGQRVGLAFMRGLRLALKKPLIGLTTLEIMAAAAADETGMPRAAAVHDARRGEAYLLLRDNAQTVLEPAVLPFDQALEAIAGFGPCALAGTGTSAAAEATGFPISSIRQPDALWLAQLARHRPVPADVPGPLYLRAPDAKLPAGGRSVTVPLFDPTTGDSALLAALHATSFEKPWNTAAIAALLATPGTFAFHLPEGFVMARVAAGESEILTIAVTPAARGQGLGRALLTAAASHSQQLGATDMFLEVGVDNPAARALYARLGFAKVGQRKAYYTGGDALVLRLPLADKFA